MRSYFQRASLALKKAYLTPTLPDNIIKIQSYPIIRILRVLGGISILMIISKSYLNFHISVLFISYFFILIFAIYNFIITFYRFKHMRSVFKSDKLDIKNSPRDRLATLFAKALWCVKGTCEAAQGIGVALTVGYGFDVVLKNTGRDPVFIPAIADFFKKILPVTSPRTLSQELELAGKSLQKKSELITEIDEARKKNA